MKISIIGDGGWGSANAILLANSGHDVTLWGAFPGYVAEMEKSRENTKFLPGVKLPPSITLTSDCSKVRTWSFLRRLQNILRRSAKNSGISSKRTNLSFLLQKDFAKPRTGE